MAKATTKTAIKTKKANKKVFCVLEADTFRGRARGKVNAIAKLIYAGKFDRDPVAIEKLASKLSRNVSKRKFDLITFMQTDNNPFNLPKAVATLIGEKKDIEVKSTLSNGNKVGRGVKGRKVLLIEDVIYTGATMRRAVKALEAGGAAHVCVLAMAKSLSYKHKAGDPTDA